MKKKIHELKTSPDHFLDVLKGNKLAELRKNDRDFKVGDTLILQEFDGQKLTGNEHRVTISHILNGGQHGLSQGYAVLSIKTEI